MFNDNNNDSLDIAGVDFKIITASHPLDDDNGKRYVIEVEMDSRILWVDPRADALQRLEAVKAAVSQIESQLIAPAETLPAQEMESLEADFDAFVRKVFE